MKKVRHRSKKFVKKGRMTKKKPCWCHKIHGSVLYGKKTLALIAQSVAHPGGAVPATAGTYEIFFQFFAGNWNFFEIFFRHPYPLPLRKLFTATPHPLWKLLGAPLSAMEASKPPYHFTFFFKKNWQVCTKCMYSWILTNRFHNHIYMIVKLFILHESWYMIMKLWTLAK